ncbi:proteasome activator complex subunit 4A isoform X1 [Hydra vulgaris]|uniref:proteasome activator complex subunit 4A isoform X1 n=1 Tax=Hydra vulgaris TaxID=6087 RepID=UPI0032EA545F
MDKPLKYQHSNIYNNLLPYSKDLEKEALQNFSEIKYNLGRAVLFVEFSPGVLVWCNRLESYIRFYGFKFSKTDHVLLIKLIYQLLIIPDLEPQYVKGFTNILCKLLKKEKLLARNDLELEWRPLYKLIQAARCNKLTQIGLKKYPCKYLESLVQLVKIARSYFSVESTVEMLLEWRPLMCVFDATKRDAAFYFSCFLPTWLPYEHHNKGFRLWFTEFLEYWFHCTHNHANVAESYMNLFARLTQSNVGFIDWNPYLPKIFNQFLSGLNLPVTGAAHHKSSRQDVLLIAVYTKWFVYMIGGQCKVLEFLENLFVTLESFYHPSNHGGFSHVLLVLVHTLAQHFVQRLHIERYAKPNWQNQIRDEFKITDKDIERFVLMLKDICLLSMYSKSGSGSAAVTLQNLALLRADIVLPSVIDRTVEALETIVEPHQVTAALQCLTSVSRTLVSGGDHFPAAPTHILTLLYAVLPGIDPNDFHKTMASFSFISSILGQIPLVNCMSALNAGIEMTEIERELCLMSGQLEDYLLQLIDRCFFLVENLSTEQISEQDNKLMENMNVQEGMLGIGLSSTVQVVFTQSSPTIFKALLDCLFTFVTNHVLEVNVAGKIVSDMCRAAAKAYPTITLKKFFTHISSVIVDLSTAEGVKNEENVDPKLLWYLEVLSEIYCDGMELLPYREMLNKVLSLTLHMKCKKVYSRAGKLLKHVLCSCSNTYAVEFRSLNIPFDRDPVEHFYIRDWGKCGHVNELKMNWHTPSVDEQMFVNELLKQHLLPELEMVESYISGKHMTRDELHRRIQIIAVCISGCAALLPMWNDILVEVTGPSSMVSRQRLPLLLNQSDLPIIEMCVSRKLIIDLMHRLYEFILAQNEDDTKSFRSVARIYEYLNSHFGVNLHEFNQRMKNAGLVKAALADKLHGCKYHLRAILVEHIQLHHEMRVLYRVSSLYTLTDQIIVHDLVKMSTSAYTEVRIDAQKILSQQLNIFDYSARSILPLLLGNLKEDPSISHEKLKGTLYLFLNSNLLNLITHYFEVLDYSWPVFVQANHSEKLSIVTLIQNLCSKISLKYDTLGIKRQMTENCEKAAYDILKSDKPTPSLLNNEQKESENPVPIESLIMIAKSKVEESNQQRLKFYYSLHDQLVDLCNSKSLHWRGVEYCIKFLLLLRFESVEIPIKTASLFVNLLVSDSLVIRQDALRGVNSILHQQKPKFEKVVLDYKKYGFSSSPSELLNLQPGDNRLDNEWLQFKWIFEPKSQEDLEKYHYVDKTHWSFQTWPVELKIYSPTCLVERTYNESNPYHMLFKKFFSDEELTNSFFKFVSLEVKKGEDSFYVHHFQHFKLLCQNFGSTLLVEFKKRIEEFLSENIESKHRCAAEMISGIIRGCRNWKYDDLESFWSFVCLQLKAVFSTNIMPELLTDWSTALAHSTESRDPNRLHHLFRMLLENPISSVGGSFGDSSRLFILIRTIAQQEWRMADVYHDLLEYLKPHFSHYFKNVRDRIGSVLSHLFMYDLKYGGYTKTKSPHIDQFIDFVLPELVHLKLEILNESSVSNKDHVVIDNSKTNHSNHEIPIRSEESKSRDRVAKTVLGFLFNTAFMMQPMNKEIFKLIPVLMVLEAREDDQEMVQLCKKAFSTLATKQLDNDVIEVAIPLLKEVCSLKSWNARKAGLNYFKIMIFHNFFTFNNDVIKKEVKDLVLERLKDEQLEVRDEAATLLSGLIHYGYFTVTKELCTVFSEMARTKVKKLRYGVILEDPHFNTSFFHIKHGGVLGLSACVLAYPYEVPIWMPEVLLDLGNYIHSYPQIQATVKKALSEFRRTHHDSWHIHRQKFTEDQLTQMNDLLASPSYYA